MDASRARGCRGGANDNSEVLTADRAAAGRTGRPARLRLARRVCHRRSDGRHAGGGARAPPGARRARRPERRPRAGGAPGHHRCVGARAVSPRGARLGVLHREGAAGRVRHRHHGAATVVRGRAGAPGRRLRRGEQALRRDLHRAHGPLGVPPRQSRLRGAQRRRQPLSASSCSTSTRATRSAAGRG